MTEITQTTTIIRQRGQLTIPKVIRKKRRWAASGAVVRVVADKPDEIILKPYAPHPQATDWKQVWKSIKKARSTLGKNKSSLSEFIVKDRETHF